MSRHIKASEFKAKCLALMDEVARTGTAVVLNEKRRPRDSKVDAFDARKTVEAEKRAALRPPVRNFNGSGASKAH